MVHRLRPAGEHEIGELTPAVREAADVAARRAVLERELDLLDLEPGPDGVDRHPRLDPEAHREREHGCARTRRQPSLPGERLARSEAAAEADQRPRRLLRKPEAAPRARRERGDRELGLRAPRAGAGRHGCRRRRAAAARARAGARRASAPDPCRAGRAGSRGRRPPRRPLPFGRASRRRRSRSRRPGNCSRSASIVRPIRPSSSRAATRIVSRSLTPVSHPCAGTGGIGGSTPSFAGSRTP